MRRSRTPLVLVTLSVAALVMAVGIYFSRYIPILLSKESGREMLEEWVKNNTNAELVGGWVAPVAFPKPGVSINDLELALNRGKKREDFIKVSSILVAADGFELLMNRRLVWNRVALDRPEINLHRGHDKTWNAARLLKKRENQKAPPSRPERSFIRWMAREAIENALPETREEWLEILTLSSFRIENARVRLADRADGKRIFLSPVDLRNVNFAASGSDINHPVKFELSFPFPPGAKDASPMRFSGEAEFDASGKVRLNSFSGGWRGIKIRNLSGNATFRPLNFSANVDLSFDYSSFLRAVTWPPVAHSKTLPFTTGSGTVRLTANISGLDSQKPFKVRYRGKAYLDNVDWDPGRVIAGIEGLETMISLDDGVLTMAPDTVKVGGNIVRGSGRVIEAKHPKFLLDIASDQVDFRTFFVGRKLDQRYGGRMLPMKTEWGGTLDLKEGRYKKMVMTDAKGTWDVNDDRILTFPALAFNACGGSYAESGRSYVDFNHRTTYKFRFDGRIRDIDVTSFVDQVFNTTVFLHGKARGDGHVTGAFVSGKFDTRRLNGKLALNITDGYFEGYNLFGALFKMFKMEVPKQLAGLSFRRMAGTTTMKDGVAYTEDLVVEAPGLRGEVKGWIDFASKHCDLKVRVILFGELADVVVGLPILGEPIAEVEKGATSVYVRAYGHWDSLKFTFWNPFDFSPPDPPAPLEVKDGSTDSP